MVLEAFCYLVPLVISRSLPKTGMVIPNIRNEKKSVDGTMCNLVYGVYDILLCQLLCCIDGLRCAVRRPVFGLDRGGVCG